MQYLDLIIKIGGSITALGLILRAVVAIVHLADDMKKTKAIVEQNLPNVKDIPDIKRHCEENYMASLRLTIMSQEMPIGERIIAGQKYLDAGGNGEIKKFLNDNLHINQRQQ